MSSKSDLKTKIEKYPLPSTVDGICSLVREILGPGLVQRIEIDINNPVRVIRALDTKETDLEEVDIDLEGALRNVAMIEYTSEDASPFQIVYDMMVLVEQEKLNAVCWATGASEAFLCDWFELGPRGMPSNMRRLLGLPIHTLNTLPEDTLILCASPYPSAEASEISLAIKTAIEIRRPKHVDEQRVVRSRKADAPVRNDPTQRRQTAGELALATGGLHPVPWKPAGDVG
jgi:hypothetical protein